MNASNAWRTSDVRDGLVRVWRRYVDLTQIGWFACIKFRMHYFAQSCRKSMVLGNSSFDMESLASSEGWKTRLDPPPTKTYALGTVHLLFRGQVDNMRASLLSMKPTCLECSMVAHWVEWKVWGGTRATFVLSLFVTSDLGNGSTVGLGFDFLERARVCSRNLGFKNCKWSAFEEDAPLQPSISNSVYGHQLDDLLCKMVWCCLVQMQDTMLPSFDMIGNSRFFSCPMSILLIGHE